MVSPSAATRDGSTTRDGSSSRVHDVVGIGLGPFNLGLACLAEPCDLDAVFLEARPDFDWHPGMLLPEATLQVPFLADLVTMADPTSPYSFLAYLKDQGRLYPFYIRESFYPLRTEFNEYCRWAARRLPSVVFDRAVERVEHDGTTYVVRSRDPRTGEAHLHRARRIVVGTGTPIHVPAPLRDLLTAGPACHSGQYLAHRAMLRLQRSITVVGSGQSAAEIYLDLLEGIEDGGYELTWVTRSPRFFPLEYTKLTLEMTSPEYTRYFHGLPGPTRDRLLASQRGLYKGISGELIDRIHDALYRLHAAGPDPRLRTRLLTNTTVVGGSYDGTTYQLDLRHEESATPMALSTDGLVLATGYRSSLPDLLAPVRDRIRWDDLGRPDVHAHYAIDHAGQEIFVQNAEEHTHGFVAPDLGMGAHRNSVILSRLLGHAPYRIEERIAFQEFGAPPDLVAAARQEVPA